MENPKYLSLYVVLDTDYLTKKKVNPIKALLKCLKGGATCVQLRSKSLSDAKFFEISLKMKKMCASSGVPFIINDRVDIAMLSGADGIHVGDEDIPYSQVKKIFKGIIGVSADSVKEALKLDKIGASYIGLGPVYPTSQKDKKPVGIKAMGRIAQLARTPVVAIGGINEYNIPELKRSGIRNFSFISGILGSKNILAKTKMVSSLICHKEP